jgi:hypothetical protein
MQGKENIANFGNCMYICDGIVLNLLHHIKMNICKLRTYNTDTSLSIVPIRMMDIETVPPFSKTVYVSGENLTMASKMVINNIRQWLKEK